MKIMLHYPFFVYQQFIYLMSKLDIDKQYCYIIK